MLPTGPTTIRFAEGTRTSHPSHLTCRLNSVDRVPRLHRGSRAFESLSLYEVGGTLFKKTAHGSLVYLEAHELETLMETVRTGWGPRGKEVLRVCPFIRGESIPEAPFLPGVGGVADQLAFAREVKESLAGWMRPQR
jgi:hypothetical protein